MSDPQSFQHPSISSIEQNLSHAIAHHERGRLQDAQSLYLVILQAQPDHPTANHNMGVLAGQLGQHAVALPYLKKSLEIDPLIGQYALSYAHALLATGQAGEALHILQSAMEQESQAQIFSSSQEKAESHFYMATAFLQLRKLDEAVSSFRRAIEIKPDFSMAHNNLGTALKDLGHIDAAVASLRRAVEIAPGYAEAHYNLGNALRAMGQFDEAVASYRRALAINPDIREAHSNLLFAQNCSTGQPSAAALADARRYGELAARHARPYTQWQSTPEPDRCLRVGLVSGDLRSHPVGHFIESVLAALKSRAAGRIDIFGYTNHPVADAMTDRIRSCCSGWRSAAGQSDQQLAKQIHDDRIDILIDLSGHTASTRLSMFAWKAAPVQVSWLGYFATTGLAAIDYFIADPWMAPKSVEQQFTETIVRLPETFLCFTPPDIDAHVDALPALANGHVTFGCFNNLIKVNDAVIALWAKVLHAVPGSRLRLKDKQFDMAPARQKMVDRFAAHGIDSACLTLEGATPRADYLAAYNRIDIALDPFPFPGGTTSVEALWMGVPVLSMSGASYLSHQGESILRNAGLPDWIVKNPDEYVSCAVRHAADLQALAALRGQLRQQLLASPLCDANRFAMHLEAALRDIWKRWCDQRRQHING